VSDLLRLDGCREEGEGKKKKKRKRRGQRKNPYNFHNQGKGEGRKGSKTRAHGDDLKVFFVGGWEGREGGKGGKEGGMGLRRVHPSAATRTGRERKGKKKGGGARGRRVASRPTPTHNTGEKKRRGKKGLADHCLKTKQVGKKGAVVQYRHKPTSLLTPLPREGGGKKKRGRCMGKFVLSRLYFT